MGPVVPEPYLTQFLAPSLREEQPRNSLNTRCLFEASDRGRCLGLA
jgi:hypothetical protein